MTTLPTEHDLTKLPMVPISSIIIKDRDRRNFGNLVELAESIKRLGFIHPPVVDSSPEGLILLAGERRLRAAVLAGLTDVPVIYRENLTPIERKEIELEENIRRKNLEWPEEVEAKRQLDELKREIHGHKLAGKSFDKSGWSLRQTADSLGEALGSVSEDLQLAKFLRKHPEKRDELAKLPKTTALRRIKELDKTAELQRKVSAGQISLSADLICGDAVEELSKLPSESFDLVLTDPPFGMETFDNGIGKKGFEIGAAHDNLSPSSALALLARVIPELARVLRPGRHIYLFLTPEHLNPIHQLMSEFFQVSAFPLIWNKNQTQTAFTGLSYCRSYEFILFGYRTHKIPSDIRLLTRTSSDILTYSPVPPKARDHAFEKPLDLLKFLITQSTSVGERVLDPFCGSGSTLIASKQLSRSGLGIELNPDHSLRAQNRLQTEVELPQGA